MSWVLGYYLVLHGAGLWRYRREPRRAAFVCLLEAPILWGLWH